MNKIKKLLKKQGFTLVELIIVIAIIAVLAVAAFMMLTKWLGKSRDSRRLGDLSTIAKGLQVGYSDTDNGVNMYPTVKEQIGAISLLSGNEVVGYQGLVDNEVIEAASMQKTPKDPSDQSYYTYLVTQNRQKFQLLAFLENGIQVGVLNNVYALDYLNMIPTTKGFDLGIILRSEDNMPANLIGESVTGVDLIGNTEYKAIVNDTTELIGTEMQNAPVVSEELIDETEQGGDMYSCEGSLVVDNANITNNTDLTENISYQSDNLDGDCYYTCKTNYSGTNCEIYSEPAIITNTDCTAAGWYWVEPENDVYIGTTRGDGFCISPRFGDWNNDSNTGNGGISWNGWGNSTTSYFRGWNANSIDDTGNPYPQNGQTKKLDSEVSYNCKSLGTAASDYDTNDTIVGRMKWLATTGNDYNEVISIAWIVEDGTDTPLTAANGHSIPALFVADCIDGIKDLGKDMVYVHNNNGTEEVTYSEYSTDVTSNTNTVALSNEVYQNRQKYLIAWTQQSGSHLPSAMSYINSGYASAGDSDGNNLVGEDRGEYQIACEASLLVDGNDDTDDERIWLSAIGGYSGNDWGCRGRMIGGAGCGGQNNYYTGSRGNASTRFVVRP